MRGAVALPPVKASRWRSPGGRRRANRGMPALPVSWHRVPGGAVEVEALRLAGALHTSNPLRLHGARAVPGLAANDDPVDAGQIEVAEVLKQRLDAQESDARWDPAQVLDARDTMSLVLDRHSDPYVV